MYALDNLRVQGLLLNQDVISCRSLNNKC